MLTIIMVIYVLTVLPLLHLSTRRSVPNYVVSPFSFLSLNRNSNYFIGWEYKNNLYDFIKFYFTAIYIILRSLTVISCSLWAYIILLVTVITWSPTPDCMCTSIVNFNNKLKICAQESMRTRELREGGKIELIEHLKYKLYLYNNNAWC